MQEMQPVVFIQARHSYSREQGKMFKGEGMPLGYTRGASLDLCAFEALGPSGQHVGVMFMRKATPLRDRATATRMAAGYYVCAFPGMIGLGLASVAAPFVRAFKAFFNMQDGIKDNASEPPIPPEPAVIDQPTAEPASVPPAVPVSEPASPAPDAGNGPVHSAMPMVVLATLALAGMMAGAMYAATPHARPCEQASLPCCHEVPKGVRCTSCRTGYSALH